jgi:acetylornithine deacetylase
LLTPLERSVCDEVERRRDDLVGLLRSLIGFDTTTHQAGEPPRAEAALQAFLADRLRGAGADVRVWEPDASRLVGHAMIPNGFDFAGRPQLAATFRGSGAGPVLLFNGHIDVVAPGSPERWRRDPFAAAVADGQVYGRGACDMKGGVACMSFAAEVLASLGVGLAGDLIVNTVSEEESTGAGGLAMARELRADAAIVPEPSGLDVWIACRGSLLPTITVEGRAGHAAIAPAPPEAGGSVNAIEKATLVLGAVIALRDEWASRPRHRFLSPASIVPTRIEGGEWMVSYPASCRLDLHVQYLPESADAAGYGSQVEREIEECVARAAAEDPWLRVHPPRVEWLVGGVPPSEVSAGEPIVGVALAAARATGRASELGGLDNWHDGASLTVEGGIPAICFGPGEIRRAHTVDESVPIADLVDCTKALAICAMRFCGLAGGSSSG